MITAILILVSVCALLTQLVPIAHVSKERLVMIRYKVACRAIAIPLVQLMLVVHATLQQVTVHVCQTGVEGAVTSVNLVTMGTRTAESVIVMKLGVQAVIQSLEDASVK